jgi:pimeloyl-ACP methyl ester carboxylesterase
LRENRIREVDGVAVREWGEPAAPTAVFWHGLGPFASGAYGRELAPALVARGWRLLAPDAPGCGRSAARDPAAYGLDEIADLLLAPVDGPVAVIGHSWGGSLAVAAAARRPELVTALVLLDPAIVTPVTVPASLTRAWRSGSSRRGPTLSTSPTGMRS